MVALGTAMALVALWVVLVVWRRRDIAAHRSVLRALVVVAPFGFIATEAGWMVTEIGRQPWIIQGVMLTRDAVTPMPGLIVPFLFFTALYVGLAVIVVMVLMRQIAITTPRVERR
jgi:cytochrome d ubiquinol oxidase subunit I